MKNLSNLFLMLVLCIFIIGCSNNCAKEEVVQEAYMVENIESNKVFGLCEDAVEIETTQISFKPSDDIFFTTEIALKVIKPCETKINMIYCTLYDENKNEMDNLFLATLMGSSDGKMDFIENFQNGLQNGSGTYNFLIYAFKGIELSGMQINKDFEKELPRVKYFKIMLSDREIKNEGLDTPKTETNTL